MKAVVKQTCHYKIIRYESHKSENSDTVRKTYLRVKKQREMTGSSKKSRKSSKKSRKESELEVRNTRKIFKIIKSSSIEHL